MTNCQIVIEGLNWKHIFYIYKRAKDENKQ